MFIRILGVLDIADFIPFLRATARTVLSSF